jgi:putative acetyltransferase
MNLVFAIEDPGRDDVRKLLQTHLDFCHAVTPAEHSFALDVEKLREPGISVFGARSNGTLLAVGALKNLGNGEAELKSMHTSLEARGQGIGRAMVAHIVSFAKSTGITRVNLETGSHPPYEPARKLYESFGFKPCAPFGDYEASDFNTFMSIAL